MMMIMLFAALGFCLGGVMFSYHIPKLFMGVDIVRESADHNPGASNAIKLAGVPAGTVCLVCDILKGFVPVFLACRFADRESILFSLVMFAPVLGHAMAPLYKFRGGKAIAVSFGVLLGIVPHSAAVAVLAVLYVFFSLVVVVNPHERRSAVTFAVFAVLSVIVGLALTHRAQYAAGCIMISALTAIRNLRGMPHADGNEAPDETENHTSGGSTPGGHTK